MKKTLLGSLVLLMACTMLMVGCKKDEPEAQTTAKAEAAVFKCSFSVTDDMLKVADFTISYYDKDGKLQTEKMESNKWEKSIMAKLPAKLGARVEAALKQDYDASKYEKFTEERTFTYSAYSADKDGKSVGQVKGTTLLGKTSMKGEKVPDYFAKKYPLKALYKFDADGNITEPTEWK